MLDGHSSFVRIVQLLSGWSGERDALVAAVDQYYAAVIHARSWPPELLERSRGINLRLATTNIANLSGTSDAAARVADELLWFAQIGIRRGQQGG